MRFRGLRLPWCSGRARRLELHTQSVGNAIDKSEIAHDGASIVYRAVVESCVTQRVDVGETHRCRIESQPVGVNEQSCFGTIELGNIEARMLQRGDHSLHRRGISVLSPNPTETRSVMSQSISASVQCGHPHPEQLTLPARKRTRAVHEFPVQRVVVMHDGRMHAVYLKDVVSVRNPVRIRELILAQVAYEGHWQRYTASPANGQDAGDPAIYVGSLSPRTPR